MLKEFTSDPGTRAILIGAVANLFLSVVKIVGGIFGTSAAMIADGIHSLSDLLTDAVVLLSHRIGQIPPDDNHPYGHGRIENIGATLVGTVIIIAGFGLAYDSGVTAFGDTHPTPHLFAAIAAVISILTNEGLFRYTRMVGEEAHSPSLIANAWHHRSDAISSIAALTGIVGGLLGYPIMDPIAAIVVSFMIVKVGYDIVRSGFKDLMDTGMSEQKAAQIEARINQVPGVIRCHDLRSRKVGGKFLLDVHIMVPKESTVTEGHHAAESVRRSLVRDIENIEDVMVHVDAEDDEDFEPIYWASREDLVNVANPVIDSVEGIESPAQIRAHFHQGKTQLEVFVRLTGNPDSARERHILNELKSKLKNLEHVDDVRVFLDVND